MNKRIILIGVIICAMLAITIIPTFNGEINYYQRKLEKVSEYTGYPYLGTIDCYSVSKSNGKFYDEEAVKKELCRMAGIPETSRISRSLIESTDKMNVCLLKIYKAGQNYLTDKVCRVEKYYLYIETF